MSDLFSALGSELPTLKPNPLGKRIGFGCSGAVILLLLIGLISFFLVRGAKKGDSNELTPACSQYLAKIESKDFSGAWALMGEEGKNALSEERHNQLMKGITERLGPVLSTDIMFFHVGSDQSGRWGRIIYATKFRNGSGTIRFELKMVSNEFRVVGVFYESPLLIDYINKATSSQP
jgi:hypothetical protein